MAFEVGDYITFQYAEHKQAIVISYYDYIDVTGNREYAPNRLKHQFVFFRYLHGETAFMGCTHDCGYDHLNSVKKIWLLK